MKLEGVNDFLKEKFEGQSDTLGLQISDIEGQIELMFKTFATDIQTLHGVRMQNKKFED
jgi:hypothetical protein